MTSNSPHSASLLGQSMQKSPVSGANPIDSEKRRRRIAKSSSREGTHDPVLKHKLLSPEPPESNSKLSWQNFKEISAPDTAEKFLWDANISSEVGRVDNLLLKDILVFSVSKYKRSRPIQMRAYQLLQDLTLSTACCPFYSTEELRERFDCAIDTLEVWRTNEYVLAACFDYLASLYIRDLRQDYTEATPSLISIAVRALTEHEKARAVVRAVIALLVKLYEVANVKTISSSPSVNAFPRIISVLQQSAEEKAIIYQCCSIFCTVAERKPELLHDICEDLLTSALRVLPYHRKNADMCASVYTLINEISIEDKLLQLLLDDSNNEFDFLCRSIPMFQACGNVDAIDSVLMLVKKCVSTTHAEGIHGELDVVSVCVGDARRHQPVCKDIADCMTHSYCGITQLHLALCSAIEDAVAVLAMNAEGADIIDISIHQPSSAPLHMDEVRSDDAMVGMTGSSDHEPTVLSCMDISDRDNDSLTQDENGDEAGERDSVNSDECHTKMLSASAENRSGGSADKDRGGWRAGDRTEKCRDGDSIDGMLDTESLSLTSQKLKKPTELRIASRVDIDLTQRHLWTDPSVVTEHTDNRKKSESGSITSGTAPVSTASQGRNDATLVLIKSLQREVEEWKSKYDMMKEAHDMILEMVASQEHTPQAHAVKHDSHTAPKAWSPIKLDNLDLDVDELQAYHNGEMGEGDGGFLDHQEDIRFDESDYHSHNFDYDVESTREMETGADGPKRDDRTDGLKEKGASVDLNEAFSRVPQEDSKSIIAGVRAAYDYMAQCQIKSSQKTQTALSSLHMSLGAKAEKRLQLAALEPGLLKEFVFVMAIVFHYLRTRQAATAEKITGSGGKTRYSITRATLRRALLCQEVNLMHHSKLPLPEVDIILHLLPVQVDLYSVAFAFVACSIRRARLTDFYNFDECSSIIQRLLHKMNKFCAQKDMLGWNDRSFASTTIADGNMGRSMFLAQISNETRQQSMKLLGKEDACLQAMFRIYTGVSDGLDLTAVVQITRDFGIIPVLLTMEHVIAIFERACSLSTNPKMRSSLDYSQFKVLLLEIAQSCNCFGELNSTGGPKYIEKVATLLWFMSNSSGRERMLERDRCAACVPPFKVNWRIFVFEQPTTSGTRDKLKTASPK